MPVLEPIKCKVYDFKLNKQVKFDSLNKAKQYMKLGRHYTVISLVNISKVRLIRTRYLFKLESDNSNWNKKLAKRDNSRIPIMSKNILTSNILSFESISDAALMLHISGTSIRSAIIAEDFRLINNYIFKKASSDKEWPVTVKKYHRSPKPVVLVNLETGNDIVISSIRGTASYLDTDTNVVMNHILKGTPFKEYQLKLKD